MLNFYFKPQKKEERLSLLLFVTDLSHVLPFLLTPGTNTLGSCNAPLLSFSPILE